MENHFRSNLVSRKNEVSYALQYFEGSAETWWQMHQAIQGWNGARTWEKFKKTLTRSRLIQKHHDTPRNKPCACKICGEIGHTQEEHKDGCPHCEEKHPAEECPTSQVTCFLCEGTTHYPAQCHIYPTVEQTIQKQEEGMKEALREVMKEPVMKECVEDPDGEGLNRFYSNACYSCGEEGHFSQYCTKERKEYLGYFPTEAIEFDPQGIKGLIRTKKPRKRKNKDTLRTTQFLQRGTRVILPVLNVRTSGIMPIIVLKGSKELKEQAPSPRSPKTYRKLCVFIARKQDIMLLNVPTRRKLELSSWNFDMDNKSGRNQFFFS